MTRRSILATALLLGLVGCSAVATDEESVAAPSGGGESAADTIPSGGIVAGGYGGADLGDEWTREAYALAVEAIYEAHPTRAEVETVTSEVQVVAGLNYRFRIEMSGPPETRAIYRAVVFRSLDGAYELSELAKLQ